MTTPYHAKYFAHDLTRQAQPGGVDRLSMALFDACVDLNPHQIEAAMFALRSPLSKGVVLADEVGLGKTIEAGLVLCQHWAERKRKLLVICPASLRKQWALELQEKFNLPTLILDSKTYRDAVRAGNGAPFASGKVVITSFHFASRFRADVRAVPFDLVVIDEAHKLRNAYRPSNKMGQNIKWAIEERKKCLLTATPLQNSLIELYGLSSILDDLIFGDVNSFRTQYTNAGADLNALRSRLQSFCKRTLRRQVVEYIQYTERIPFTVRFRPTDDEQKLYEAVSDFLNREETYSVPQRQRHLTALILRKLLASSSHAIANTLETMKARLEEMRDAPRPDEDGERFMEELIEAEELEDDYLDEILEGTTDEEEQAESEIDRQKLGGEIDELARYAQWARSIGIDTKSRSLLKALELGFADMDKMGASRKALIFTESRRTQDYLKNFLESNGYAGQLVLFNGTNADPESRRIIGKWVEDNTANGRVTGSRAVDSRTALIEHFRDHASVMIATEAAAEGVNMQFCSLVVNYDLPWNPQRIEQRIGRCHRYGQKHDVVVINFLNERNEADRRVHELLAEKFNLFSGVFGASDEVLGQIESGVDFEKRILAIYQQCRTLQEIDAAFRQLQAEMDETIQSKMDETRQMLMAFRRGRSRPAEDAARRRPCQPRPYRSPVLDAYKSCPGRPRHLLRRPVDLRPAPVPGQHVSARNVPPGLKNSAERHRRLSVPAVPPAGRVGHRSGQTIRDARGEGHVRRDQLPCEGLHGRGPEGEIRLAHAPVPHHRLLRPGGVPSVLGDGCRRQLARSGDLPEALPVRGPHLGGGRLASRTDRAAEERSGPTRRGDDHALAGREQRPVQRGAGAAGEVGRRHGGRCRERLVRHEGADQGRAAAVTPGHDARRAESTSAEAP